MSTNKNILLIGLDGARTDTFLEVVEQLREQTEYAWFNQLMASSWLNYRTYAGGRAYDETAQTTISDPGWTTILTGHWANTSHIDEGRYLDEDCYNREIPTLANWFQLMHQGQGEVTVISDWNPFNILLNYSNTSLLKAFNYPGSSILGANRSVFLAYPHDDLAALDRVADEITTRAVTEIRSVAKPTMLLLHYDNPDHTAHEYGFVSPEYRQSLIKLAAQVNQLVAEVALKRAQGEEWLIVLTSDHGGGTGPFKDYSHGRHWWTDRQSFVVLNDDLAAAAIVDRSIQGHASLVPTILARVGFRSELVAQFVSEPAFGQAPLQANYLRLDANTKTLEPGYPYPLALGWHDLAKFGRSSDDIRTILFHGNKHDDYSLIFKENTFLTYNNLAANRFSYQGAGCLVPINEQTWPEVAPYASEIRFALHDPARVDSYYIFLSDNRFVHYDSSRDQVDLAPQMIDEQSWPGVSDYLPRIKFAFYAPCLAGVYYFFLQDNSYVRYSISQQQLLDEQPQLISDENWPGLAVYATSIACGFYSAGKIHFITEQLASS